MLVLIGSLLLIFGAAMLFTNAIEWLGCRLHLGSSFVGAILSPLFTSLPELIVFLVAILAYGGQSGQEIGIGTLFGQPFMASSLSYGLVGLTVLLAFALKRRRTRVMVIHRDLMIPYLFVIILFPLSLAPDLIGAGPARHLFGLVFLAAFIAYIWLMYRRRKRDENDVEGDAPYFCAVVPKNTGLMIAATLLQIVVAVGLLYIGSSKMVATVSELSTSLGISAMGLALIIVPAATAIPETAGALVWAFRGRDTLAMGALVGEKILFSTFYPGLGMLVTSWALDIHAYLSVVATTIISLLLLYFIARQRLPWWGLCFGVLFFITYAVLIFQLHV